MTTRVLPPEEWPKLAGTELEQVWPVLGGQDAQVLVVEDGDQIVGCWAVIRYVHVEGLWIAPSHRGKASVGRRLLAAMRAAARALGAGAVWTAAESDDVRGLIARYGGMRLPADHYVLPLRSEACRP